MAAVAEALAEREAVGLGPGSIEADLERAVGDRPALANQLMEPLLGQRAATLFVNVKAMRVTGRFSVDEDAERDGSASPSG